MICVKWWTVPINVRVRKYQVDTLNLQRTLRSHKSISNKAIADKLGVPLTQVEHWFRTDKYFAIPDENLWMSLKELLKIDTNEFDESILTFETKIGTYEKSERIYASFGLCPTITTFTNDLVVAIFDE